MSAHASGPVGEVAFVLHTHLPEVRNHGVWPVGEEWLFQAWASSWLPVTAVLERLADDGHRGVLTLGVTPAVAAQVADPRTVRDLGTWLAGQLWRSEEQRRHPGLDAEVRALSAYHWRRFRDLLEQHEDVERRGGLLAVWASLADRGVIELLGGPATHPYLPLEPDPAIVRAQLEIGLAHHRRWAGRPPSGLWPPELGYRPRGQVADPTAAPLEVAADGTPTLRRSGPERPGLEEHYAALGIEHVVVDAPTVLRAAGAPARDRTVRPELPDPSAAGPEEVVYDGVLIGDSEVAAYARDLAVAYHVWSPRAGYPGDGWYLDFHAHGTFGVHPSWRVTDVALPSEHKAPYVPAAAADRVAAHAAHLHGVLRAALDHRPGAVVVAAFDTELFGHWWHEGPAWLEAVLRRVVTDPRLATTTLAERRRRRPPTRRLALPESSWGYAKGHASWATEATRPLWATLRDAQARARSVLAGGRGRPATRAQVARELAQLSASDWPFMITRGGAEGYARERVTTHAARVRALTDAIASGTEDALTGALEVDRLAALDASPQDVGPLVAALDPTGGGADVAGSDVAGSDVAGSDVAGSDVAGSDVTGSDVAGP